MKQCVARDNETRLDDWLKGSTFERVKAVNSVLNADSQEPLHVACS